MGKIPCTYIGNIPVRLDPHGSYTDANGKPLESLSLKTGDTLMLPEEEVLGFTMWHDPRGVLFSEKLGVGKVVKPEHKDFDRETLLALGYEWHDGRSDFKPITQAPAPQIPAQAPAPTPFTLAPIVTPIAPSDESSQTSSTE